MMEELKSLHAENEKLKSKLAKEALGDVMSQVKDMNGVKVLATKVADVDMNGLQRPRRPAQGEAGRRRDRAGIR